jgi:hypothetical protein
MIVVTGCTCLYGQVELNTLTLNISYNVLSDFSKAGLVEQFTASEIWRRSKLQELGVVKGSFPSVKVHSLLSMEEPSIQLGITRAV